MAGSVEGGKKASITNKSRYGDSFYKTIGRAGGKERAKGGNFYFRTIRQKDPEYFKNISAEGGRMSRKKS